MSIYTFLDGDGGVLDVVRAKNHDEAVANARDGVEWNTRFEKEDIN